HTASPFLRLVVVIRGEPFPVRFPLRALKAEIKPHQIGLTFVNDLGGPCIPVVQVLLGGSLAQFSRLAADERRWGMRLAIKAGIFSIRSIKILVVGVVRPVKGSVGRNSQMQPLLAHRPAQLAYNVPARAHFHGVPFRAATVVHGKAIVVLADGNDVFRARLPEQLSPVIRIPFLRRELRDEVLVPEYRLGAEMLQVIIKNSTIPDVNISRIPFVIVGGHRENTPMEEDSELGVQVPVWHSILLKGIP